MNRFFAKINNDFAANSKYILYTPNSSAEGLPFQVTACGHFYNGKNYCVERAGADFYLVIITLSGSGEIYYKGKHFILKKGHALLIDCNEYHHYQTYSGAWEIKWVRFHCHMQINYHRLINKDALEIISLENALAVGKVIDRMIELSQKSEPTTDFNLSHLMSTILTALCVQQYANSTLHIASSTKKLISDAILYIEKNYADPISIDAIANTIYMSKYSFIRLFKKQTGLSPYEYLLKVRITEAKLLLEQSNYSINEISEMVGFRNQNAFIRKFKQLTVTTPLKYRKLNC